MAIDKKEVKSEKEWLVNQAMDEKLSYPVPKWIFGRTDITITTFADKYFKNEEDKKRLIDILNE